jgi:hypothetical protein
LNAGADTWPAEAVVYTPRRGMRWATLIA